MGSMRSKQYILHEINKILKTAGNKNMARLMNLKLTNKNYQKWNTKEAENK